MKPPALLFAALLGLSLSYPAVASAERESPPDPPRQEGAKPDPPRPEAPSREAKPEAATRRDAPPRGGDRPRSESQPRGETEPRRSAERPPAPEERGAGRRYELPQGPTAEARTLTYLGVATTPLPHSLRDHLGLPDGFGLQVREVSPDSPAAKAGFEAHDILVRFDDQRLISPEHLSLLVRSAKAGDRVEFHLIRRGEEQRISVDLGEIEATDLMRGGRPHPQEWQEPMRRQQDFWHDWMQRHHPATPESRIESHRHDDLEPPQTEAEGEAAALPSDGAGGPPPSGKPPAVSMRPGFPVSVFAAEGLVKIDNEQGEAVIRFGEKGHLIELRDVDGALVHEGPWDPETGAEGLPEAARDHLRKMKLDDLNLLQFQHADSLDPERTSDEAKEKEKEKSGSIL